MKTTIGGDRLGSGNKQEVSLRSYNRSTHDLSYIWRSSMSSGTLVPFMSEVGLPGDSFDIDLNCDVKTLPTIGPLFGSYKVQLDVFSCPIRLYQGKLHMNMLNIGMDMSEVLLPQMEVKSYFDGAGFSVDAGDNEQINASSILSYLNVRGIGRKDFNGLTAGEVVRQFNAVPFLGYWDIYKNYYANKQEENGYVIHAGSLDTDYSITERRVKTYSVNGQKSSQVILNNVGATVDTASSDISAVTLEVDCEWNHTRPAFGRPDGTKIKFALDGFAHYAPEVFDSIVCNPQLDANGVEIEGKFTIVCFQGALTPADLQAQYLQGGYYYAPSGNVGWTLANGSAQVFTLQGTELPNEIVDVDGVPQLQTFQLENIDKMRMRILEAVASTSAFVIRDTSLRPYSLCLGKASASQGNYYFPQANQEGLAIKTYQSDLFNNWISTEWIDGTNGINEVTAVSTAGNEFTIDALNLANKVYTMLNRIAVSGGTYDDWLDAVYTHERARSVENPVYQGSLIRELSFEEVVSQADVTDQQGNQQPLGTLAGRGRLTNKNKGGRIKIKVDEPSYILGIVSLTPRIDYSQGNKWDTNLKSMNDLHKPALDAIGFQDLVTDQMAWFDTYIGTNGEPVFSSAGKQPAWINYMTNVNQTRGSFAEENNSMFMTLNRKYERGNRGINDLSTYIDPSKYNDIFADSRLDSQNFWVQIGVKNTARRKMSAKVIPNL